MEIRCIHYSNVSGSSEGVYFTGQVCSYHKNLPDHWQSIVRNQNQECWNLKYKYVHAPVPILSQYPRVAVKGIFGVVNDCTPETVTAKDLIHLGGQFTEYDNNDKCIWMKNIHQIQEELQGM